MGGSGGVFSKERGPEQFRDRIREQEKERDPEFDSEVSGFLDELLGRANSRDVDAIRDHLGELKKALENSLVDSVDLVFGGSIAKHTYVDGMSDVDTLVLLSDPELGSKSPERVLADFSKAIRRRLPLTEVKPGRLAVTVSFSDGLEVQLLPAVRSAGGYRIASADGAGWSQIDPRAFAERLTTANSALSGKLVPTIKLAKAINDSWPEDRRLTGYHVEALTVAAFQDYQGPRNTKAMLRHFYGEAAERVTRPIRDATRQSSHVDAYLGKANSPRRLAVSAELLRAARKMRNADGARSVAQWQALFGEFA